MPWALYVLALVAALLLQTAVLPLCAPDVLDVLLVLALVCGLAAPAAEARLCGWFTGLAQDLASVHPLGLHAFALGLTALLLTWLRDLVNLHLWWARWLIATAAALPAGLLIELHLRIYQGGARPWTQMLTHPLMTALVGGLLAAVIVGLPTALGRRRGRRGATHW